MAMVFSVALIMVIMLKMLGVAKLHGTAPFASHSLKQAELDFNLSFRSALLWVFQLNEKGTACRCSLSF